MDIQQLSTMVRDLVLQQDKVVVPGLGVFIAEFVPASFSDRGYTLNPPYRKLSFVAEGAGSEPRQEDPRNSVKADPVQLQQCLERLRSDLQSSRCVELPLLGKLRLTASGELFFVADPDLDIYPDAFGLHPVSMKNHDPHIEEAEPAPEPAPLDVETPMIEPAPTNEETPMQEENTKKKHPVLKVMGIVLLVLMVAMIAFRLLALLAPDFIDSILYSEEELRLLGK